MAYDFLFSFRNLFTWNNKMFDYRTLGIKLGSSRYKARALLAILTLPFQMPLSTVCYTALRSEVMDLSVVKSLT